MQHSVRSPRGGSPPPSGLGDDDDSSADHNLMFRYALRGAGRGEASPQADHRTSAKRQQRHHHHHHLDEPPLDCMDDDQDNLYPEELDEHASDSDYGGYRGRAMLGQPEDRAAVGWGRLAGGEGARGGGEGRHPYECEVAGGASCSSSRADSIDFQRRYERALGQQGGCSTPVGAGRKQKGRRGGERGWEAGSASSLDTEAWTDERLSALASLKHSVDRDNRRARRMALQDESDHTEEEGGDGWHHHQQHHHHHRQQQQQQHRQHQPQHEHHPQHQQQQQQHPASQDGHPYTQEVQEVPRGAALRQAERRRGGVDAGGSVCAAQAPCEGLRLPVRGGGAEVVGAQAGEAEAGGGRRRGSGDTDGRTTASIAGLTPTDSDGGSTGGSSGSDEDDESSDWTSQDSRSDGTSYTSSGSDPLQRLRERRGGSRAHGGVARQRGVGRRASPRRRGARRSDADTERDVERRYERIRRQAMKEALLERERVKDCTFRPRITRVAMGITTRMAEREREREHVKQMKRAVRQQVAEEEARHKARQEERQRRRQSQHARYADYLGTAYKGRAVPARAQHRQGQQQQQRGEHPAESHTQQHQQRGESPSTPRAFDNDNEEVVTPHYTSTPVPRLSRASRFAFTFNDHGEVDGEGFGVEDGYGWGGAPGGGADDKDCTFRPKITKFAQQFQAEGGKWEDRMYYGALHAKRQREHEALLERRVELMEDEMHLRQECTFAPRTNTTPARGATPSVPTYEHLYAKGVADISRKGADSRARSASPNPRVRATSLSPHPDVRRQLNRSPRPARKSQTPNLPQRRGLSPSAAAAVSRLYGDAVRKRGEKDRAQQGTARRDPSREPVKGRWDDLHDEGAARLLRQREEEAAKQRVAAPVPHSMVDPVPPQQRRMLNRLCRQRSPPPPKQEEEFPFRPTIRGVSREIRQQAAQSRMRKQSLSQPRNRRRAMSRTPSPAPSRLASTSRPRADWGPAEGAGGSGARAAPRIVHNPAQGHGGGVPFDPSDVLSTQSHPDNTLLSVGVVPVPHIG